MPPKNSSTATPPPSPTNYPELEAQYQEIGQGQTAQLQDGHAQTPSNQQVVAPKVQIEPADHFAAAEQELKRWLQKYLSLFRLFYTKHRLVLLPSVGGSIALIGGLLLAYAWGPQTIAYGFADQQHCIASPLLFPSLFNTSQSAFKLSRLPTLSIGHTPVFSYRLCAAAIHGPAQSATYTNRQWLSIAGLHLSKIVRIATPSYPVAYVPSQAARAIPIEKPLQFKLSQSDDTFNYAVKANGQISSCSKRRSELSCSLAPLKLAYASTYQASLVRVFGGQTVGTVLSKQLQTITAAAITQSSIGAGTVVYARPQQIILTTDKPIAAMQAVSLTIKGANGTTNVPIASSFKGQTITINIASPLLRKATFDLHIAGLTANDDSTLEQPYDLSFTTSGGPKVVSNNIPSFGLSSGQTMNLSFDQPLDPGQDPSQFTSLLVNGIKQPTTIRISGQSLSITPTGGFPVCASVIVQLSSGASSVYGVSGDSSWSYTSRSHCYTTFSIGTSVQGRPMTAYKFGSGPSTVLYIGAMEGNEQNSSQLLQQWIPEVDANPDKIPAYRSLVIIPTINPDGYAADTRLNATGIDLNRNFPANNWQEQVTEPLANTVWTNDGGPQPLSAPESQVLASYYQSVHPRLTITEHSHGGIVEANDAGDSIILGAKYAALADYRAIPTSAIGNFFDYTTTGAFEDWANDKLSLPVLEVELESPTNDEYSRNLPALWAMAQVSP